MLILARNALAASITPTEKSINSSNNTQTLDSEQNITPIEEHLDITFSNSAAINSTPTAENTNLSTARDFTKRIGSISKGIMETLKFDKRSTNPFDYEIEIGATEIHPKDLIAETDNLPERFAKSDENARANNGNNSDNRNYLSEVRQYESEEDSVDMNESKILDIFEHKTASMFHTLMPLIIGHIAALASSDPKSSVHILNLIRDILPHVAALNKLSAIKDQSVNNGGVSVLEKFPVSNRTEDNGSVKEAAVSGVAVAKPNPNDLITTSNHYCVVESDHPYKPASITNFR